MLKNVQQIPDFQNLSFFFFFLLVAIAENQHMACHIQTVGRRQEAISHGMQYQKANLKAFLNIKFQYTIT